MFHLYLCLGLSLAGPVSDSAVTSPAHPHAHPAVARTADSAVLLRQTPDTAASPDPSEIVVLGASDPTIINAPPLVDTTWTNTGYDEEHIFVRLKTFASNHSCNLVKVTFYHPPHAHYLGEVGARIYNVPDVRRYEPWIDWSADRRLTLDDFKGPPSVQNQSYSNCEFYTVLISHKLGYWVFIRTRFYTRSSSIDRSALNRADLLLHEQGAFDLCEFYRRKLDTALNFSPARSYNRSELESTYKQVYLAYLTTRRQYDSVTSNGTDHAQQLVWTRRIAAGDFPTVPILNLHQLDSQARALPPSDRLALIYLIRPKQYNSPLWKRIIYQPYYDWAFPFQIFYFINPTEYAISYDGTTQGDVKARRFICGYIRPGTCRINSTIGLKPAPSSLTLHVDPGKVYYVEMKLVERRVFALPRPEWEHLDDETGRRLLQKCRLSAYWEPPALPGNRGPLE